MDNAKEPSKDKGAIVKKVFVDFLTSNGHKITTERLTILASIYEMDNHFDLVELHYYLRQDGHRISQATIYNNIKLFERAGLIIKHRFGLGKAKYERCYFRGNHHHIIFTDTGEVKAFKDPRIREIQQMIEETYGIKVDKHSLYFYGRRCEKKEISSTQKATPLLEKPKVS